MIPVLLFVVGATLLLAGIVMVMRGCQGRQLVRAELSDQQIVFPAAERLPTSLSDYAGVRVTSGDQARAYATFIASNVAKATGGRTYSQLSDEWHAGGQTDERLGTLRETAFMGSMLRGSLLGAYQAGQTTLLVMGLGGLLIAAGVAFVALGTAWH